MKLKRCFILIDGSNFYFKLKDLKLNNLLDFDFSSFVKYLTAGKKIISSKYYIGAVRVGKNKKSQVMHAKQQKLFSHLKNHKFRYVLGYLLKSGGKYHEKGVDVNLAGEIYVATYENLCDHFILVSSDTDLLPAVNKAIEKGKSVEYIGFSHQPSLAMVSKCSESRLLKKEDLLPFLKKSVKHS